MMSDSLAEPTTPATPSVPAIGEALERPRRNFFPFSLLWFSLVALEISLIASLRIAESDIWFHLRNAQELLTRHSFLRADLYTFTTAGAPLLNFEWLSELPYYLAFRAWGQHGLLAVYLVLLWLIFAGVYYLALRRGAGVVLLTCAYNVQPIFEDRANTAVKRTTLLAVAIPRGDAQPRIFELHPIPFQVLEALDHWTTPSALSLGPELDALMADLAQLGLVEVHG